MIQKLKKKALILGAIVLVFGIGFYATTLYNDHKINDVETINDVKVSKYLNVKRDLTKIGGDINIDVLNNEKKIGDYNYLAGKTKEGNDVIVLNEDEKTIKEVVNYNKSGVGIDDAIALEQEIIPVTEKNANLFIKPQEDGSLKALDDLFFNEVKAASYSVIRTNHGWAGQGHYVYQDASTLAMLFCNAYGINSVAVYSSKVEGNGKGRLHNQVLFQGAYRTKHTTKNSTPDLKWYYGASYYNWGVASTNGDTLVKWAQEMDLTLKLRTSEAGVNLSKFTLKRYSDKDNVYKIYDYNATNQLKYYTAANYAAVRDKLGIIMSWINGPGGYPIGLQITVKKGTTGGTANYVLEKYKGWDDKYKKGYKYNGYQAGGSVAQQLISPYGTTSTTTIPITVTTVNESGNITGYKVGNVACGSTTTTTQRLAGAKYGYFDKNGKQLAQATTNSNGVFLMTKLDPTTGGYIQEISAPTGYATDKTKIAANIYAGKTNDISASLGRGLMNYKLCGFDGFKLMDGEDLFNNNFSITTGNKAEKITTANESRIVYMSEDGLKKAIFGEDGDETLKLAMAVLPDKATMDSQNLYSKTGTHYYYELEPHMAMQNKLDGSGNIVYELDGSGNKIILEDGSGNKLYEEDADGNKILNDGITIDTDANTVEVAGTTYPINADNLTYTDASSVDQQIYKYQYKAEQELRQTKNSKGELEFDYKLDGSGDKIANSKTAWYVYPTLKEMEDKHATAGVVFELRNAAGVVQDTVTTNAIGFFESTKGFNPGTYYLYETKTAPGFNLMQSAVTVKITTAGVTHVSTEVNPLWNMEGLLPLKVIKVDKETGKVLAGAEYGVYAEIAGACQLENLLKTATSDNKGELGFDLYSGNYCVQEISAPYGYYLNDEIQKVELIKGSSGAKLTFENEAIKLKVQVNKVNDSDKILSGGLFDFILISDWNEDTSNLPSSVKYGEYNEEGIFIESEEPTSQINPDLDTGDESTTLNEEIDPMDVYHDEDLDGLFKTKKIHRIAQFEIGADGTYLYDFDTVMKIMNGDNQARHFAIKEVKAPNQHYLAPTQYFTIDLVDGKYVVKQGTSEVQENGFVFDGTLKKPADVNDVVNINFIDKEVKIDIKIKKTDSNLKSLENIEFDVSFSSLSEIPKKDLGEGVNDETNEAIETPTTSQSVSKSNANETETLTSIGKLTTDKNGNATLKLEGDNFPFEEDGTPKLIKITELTNDSEYFLLEPIYLYVSYNKLEQKFESSITKTPFDWTIQGDVIKDETIEIEIINKIKWTESFISKVDMTGDKELPGADICVYKDDGSEFNVKTIDQIVHTGKDFCWISTDKAMMIKLETGDYIVIEIIPPKGYLKTTTKFALKIKGDGKPVELKIKNEPIKYPRTGGLRYTALDVFAYNKLGIEKAIIVK